METNWRCLPFPSTHWLTVSTELQSSSHRHYPEATEGKEPEKEFHTHKSTKLKDRADWQKHSSPLSHDSQRCFMRIKWFENVEGMKNTTQNSNHVMPHPLIYFIASRVEKACSLLSGDERRCQANANGISVARAHRHSCRLQHGIYLLLQSSTVAFFHGKGSAWLFWHMVPTRPYKNLKHLDCILDSGQCRTFNTVLKFHFCVLLGITKTKKQTNKWTKNWNDRKVTQFQTYCVCHSI